MNSDTIIHDVEHLAAPADRAKSSHPVTLEEAINVCRFIEELIAPLNAHCGLTGSCLFKGESSKDMDIFIYSHNLNERYSKVKVLEAIQNSPLAAAGLDESGPFYQVNPAYTDKDVVIFRCGGTRIDFFFLP